MITVNISSVKIVCFKIYIKYPPQVQGLKAVFYFSGFLVGVGHSLAPYREEVGHTGIVCGDRDDASVRGDQVYASVTHSPELFQDQVVFIADKGDVEVVQFLLWVDHYPTSVLNAPWVRR